MLISLSVRLQERKIYIEDGRCATSAWREILDKLNPADAENLKKFLYIKNAFQIETYLMWTSENWRCLVDAGTVRFCSFGATIWIGRWFDRFTSCKLKWQNDHNKKPGRCLHNVTIQLSSYHYWWKGAESASLWQKRLMKLI